MENHLFSRGMRSYLVLTLICALLTACVPSTLISRSEAIDIARKAYAELGIEIDETKENIIALEVDPDDWRGDVYTISIMPKLAEGERYFGGSLELWIDKKTGAVVREQPSE